MLTNKRFIQIIRLCIITLFFVLPYYLFFPYQFIGGDDSRFFLVQPKPFLEHIAPYSWFHFSGFGSYNPNQFFIPLTTLITVAQYIIPYPTIVSYAVFSMSFILAFLFFEKLLRILLPSVKSAIPIIVSLVYVLSPILIINQWNTFLNSVWLISLIPGLTYYYIQYIRSQRIAYIARACLLAVTLSVGMASIPWLLGYIIPLIICMPIILVLYRKIIFRLSFLAHSALFIVCILISQSFWLLPLAQIFFDTSSHSIRSAISANIAQDTFASTVNATAIGNIIYPILNLFHREIVESFHWTQFTAFQHYYDFTMWGNIIFPLIFIFALTKSKKTATPQEHSLYLIICCTYAVALYFFTIHIGGLKTLFLWLGHIPGWVMFRNGFDKFAPGYVFYFSLMLGYSLSIIKRAHFTVASLLLFLLTIVVGINTIPIKSLIVHPLWTTANTQTITTLPPEYTTFLDQASRLVPPTSNIINLPLNNAGYSIIPTADTNRAYVGRSLIEPLINRYDYSAYLSFPSDYQTFLKKSILANDSQSTLNILKQFNIDYAILATALPEEIKNSYLFDQPLLQAQQQQSFIEGLSDAPLLESTNNNFKLYRLKHSADNRTVTLPTRLATLSKTDTSTSDLMSILLPIIQPGIAIITSDPINHVAQVFASNKALMPTLEPGSYTIPLNSKTYSLSYDLDAKTVHQRANLHYVVSDQQKTLTADSPILANIPDDALLQIHQNILPLREITNIIASTGDTIKVLETQHANILPPTSTLLDSWIQGDCNAITNDPSIQFSQPEDSLLLNATNNHNACLYTNIHLTKNQAYRFAFDYKTNNSSRKALVTLHGRNLDVLDSVVDNDWHHSELSFVPTTDDKTSLYIYSGTDTVNATTEYKNVELAEYKEINNATIQSIENDTNKITIDSSSVFSINPPKTTIPLPPLSKWNTGDCASVDAKPAVFFSPTDNGGMSLRATDGHSACIYTNVEIQQNTFYTFSTSLRSNNDQTVPFFVQFNTSQDTVSKIINSSKNTWITQTFDFQTPPHATTAQIYLYSGQDKEKDTEIEYKDTSLSSSSISDGQTILYKEPETTLPPAPLASVTSEKISPVAYKVTLRHINQQTFLQFQEAFHLGWNVYAEKNYHWYTSLLSRPIQASHVEVNNAVNGWFIASDELCKTTICEGNTEDFSATIFLIFSPQKWFYIGSLFTCILFLCLIIKIIYYDF